MPSLPLGKVGEEARHVLEDAGVKVAAPMLHQLVAYAHAVNDGRTAQELDPRSKAALEIDALFAWTRKQASVQTALHANTKTRQQS
jgi:chromosome partitioning protein